MRQDDFDELVRHLSRRNVFHLQAVLDMARSVTTDPLAFDHVVSSILTDGAAYSEGDLAAQSELHDTDQISPEVIAEWEADAAELRFVAEGFARIATLETERRLDEAYEARRAAR